MLSAKHILLMMLYSQHLMQHIQANAPFHIFNKSFGAAATRDHTYEDTFENDEEWQPMPQNNWFILRTTQATRQAHKQHKQRSYANQKRPFITHPQHPQQQQQQQQHKQRYPPNYYAYKHNGNIDKNNMRQKATLTTSLPTAAENLALAVTTAAPTLPANNDAASQQQSTYILTLNNLLRADILARQQLPMPPINERKTFVMQQQQHTQQNPSNVSSTAAIDNKMSTVKNNKVDGVAYNPIRTRTNQIAADKEIAPSNGKQQLNNDLLMPLEIILSRIQDFCGLAKQIIKDDENIDNTDYNDGDDVDDDEDDDDVTGVSNDIGLMQGMAVRQANKVQGQYNMPVTIASTSTIATTTTATTSASASALTTAPALAKSFGASWTDIGTARKKVKKIKKKFKQFLLPLLIAYKLKFLTLIPVLIGGLTLLVGTTGLAGFFFALFTAVMSLKTGGSKSIIVKKI